MKKILLKIVLPIILIVFLLWFLRMDIKYLFLNSQVIYWSDDVEISESDFTDDINLTSKSDISYFHGLMIKKTYIQKANVKAVFYKNKSWIKNSADFKKEYKLQKVVFDLYEAYAKKYNKEIKQFRNENKTDLTFPELKEIGKPIFADLFATEDSIFNTNMEFSHLVEFWRFKIDKLLVEE
ncbi:hypothetical protein [Algibacter pectinivorans]|nr:hypothetical protein [Algibacter pectinivorans]